MRKGEGRRDGSEKGRNRQKKMKRRNRSSKGGEERDGDDEIERKGVGKTGRDEREI